MLGHSPPTSPNFDPNASVPQTLAKIERHPSGQVLWTKILGVAIPIAVLLVPT
jgi:hypothetical protein